MDCNSCEYQQFCKDAVSSISCFEIRARLKGKKVSTLKEFCDLAIWSPGGYEKCCKWCINDFLTNDCTQQFCSKECEKQYYDYKEHGIKREKLEQCLNCGEPLIFGDKFCSKTCRAEYEYHKKEREEQKNVKSSSDDGQIDC